MKREIIHIDEAACDGCGRCIPNCHEGALQIIDGKARLVSELMCDGLGACLGHCPQGAISVEEREAEPYRERIVLEKMVGKGENLVLAHFRHLLDHKEHDYVKEGVRWLKEQREQLPFDPDPLLEKIRKYQLQHVKQFSLVQNSPSGNHGAGCPGSRSIEFNRKPSSSPVDDPATTSALGQWPVQFHLVNPRASYFQGADVLLAADCSAYAMGNFHTTYLPGKRLIIGCPKLDHGQEDYIRKLVQLIDQSMINTIHVLVMEVPCCSGLLRLVNRATRSASRIIPVRCTVVSTSGKVLSEEWL